MKCSNGTRFWFTLNQDSHELTGNRWNICIIGKWEKCWEIKSKNQILRLIFPQDITKLKWCVFKGKYFAEIDSSDNWICSDNLMRFDLIRS